MNTSNAYHVIVLITVNEIETHALLDAFVGKNQEPTQVSKGGLTYNDLGVHGSHQIIHTICEMGAGGIGASQQRTRDAIDHWQPQAVIAVGIAFGLDENKQRIGDVLISKQIQDYELSRLNDDGTLTPRGDKSSSTDILCNRLRQIDIKKSRKTKKGWPKVRFGLLLSGQKLVDNLSYMKSLKALFPEAIGGEMEGVGIYVSVSKAKVDWIVIKAICDWGHNKNQGDKDAWQKLAAKNAAQVLKAALEVSGLYDDVQLQEKIKISELDAMLPESSNIPADISRIIKHAPAELIGRQAETALLSDAWNLAVRGEAKRPHIITLVAIGGEGKTSLVAKWIAELAHRGWPGCDAVFAWSFYSQGTRELTAASSDLFLKEALIFFGDLELAASAKGAFDKGQRLAQLIGRRRALLILDGVEPLQYAPTSPTPGELKDTGLSAVLKGLAATSQGMCVVTTRHSIPDLKVYWQTTAPETKLLSLSKEAGVKLLQLLGVNGSQTEYEKLVEDVQGHALTLNLLGSFLHDAHSGDIRKRDLVKLEEAADEQGGHAFRVMDAYVRWFKSGGKTVEENKKGQRALDVLRLMGLFDRPVSADCFAALLKAPVIPNLTEMLVIKNEVQRNLAFTRLADAKLLTVTRDAGGTLLWLNAHPLIREYFAKQLRTQYPISWRTAHRRLYKHLCATTAEGDQPTLEGLQPLYQAVAHGCLAEMHEEVCLKIYYTRINKKSGYSWKQLGVSGSDLGALACFFESPWSRVSPLLTEGKQSWLLNEVALRLRALGRLGESIDPMIAAVKIAIRNNQWDSASTVSSNLSELVLLLGEVAQALIHAEQSLTYANHTNDPVDLSERRMTLADALFQAGRLTEAEEYFREAEKIYAKHIPNFPLLNSIPGFQYCNLLLNFPEHTAWLTILAPSNAETSAKNDDQTTLTKVLHAVYERTVQILQWNERDSATILDIALNHLTLGRAALYEAILIGSSLTFCHESFQHAVDGLRRSGMKHYLPHALLTRAWLRSIEGIRTGPESTQSDLNEAWEIAERGPMQLIMADILLFRARLFFREGDYPWNKNFDNTPRGPKDDLTEARQLIMKLGYLRRLDELHDAEQQIL